MTAADLTALADSLIDTDRNASSWAWHRDDIGDEYIDCSADRNGRWTLEVGDGEEVAQLTLDLDELREVHRKLTLQLIVATRQAA